MRVLVQWAQSRANDWEGYDSANWSSLAARPEPQGTEILDGQRGWVQCINVQGVIFSGDHIAVEHLAADRIRVYCWNDDPDDWDPDERHAHVVTFQSLAPDPRFGGAYNTRQTHEIYAESGIAETMRTAGLDPRPWAQFAPPAAELHRHGIWLPGPLHEAHRAAASVRGWREWTEGVPAEEIVRGRVRDQRAQGRYIVPDGTRTYHHNLQAVPIGAVNADFENELGTAPAGAAQQQATGINATGSLVWAAATPAMEPDSAAWPTGDYRAQLDVVSADTDMAYGMLTLGSEGGRFLRLNAALDTVLESFSQTEAQFTLSGLKLATTGSVSWAAGADTDRWGYSVAAVRTAGHGNKQMTLELGELDDFTDGPWPSAPVGAQSNAIFFGTNA